MTPLTDADLDVIARGELPPGWSGDLLLLALVQELRLARAVAGDAGRKVIDAADRCIRCLAEFENPGACSEWIDALYDALEKCPGTSVAAICEQDNVRLTWEAEKAAALQPVHPTAQPLITAAAHSLLVALRPFRWCLGVSHVDEDGGTLVVCITAATFASELPDTWYGWPVGVMIGVPPSK